MSEAEATPVELREYTDLYYLGVAIALQVVCEDLDALLELPGDDAALASRVEQLQLRYYPLGARDTWAAMSAGDIRSWQRLRRGLRATLERRDA